MKRPLVVLLLLLATACQPVAASRTPSAKPSASQSPAGLVVVTPSPSALPSPALDVSPSPTSLPTTPPSTAPIASGSGTPQGGADTVAYDADHHQLVVLENNGATDANTWTWNGTWSEAQPSHRPSARTSAAYDPIHHDLVTWGSGSAGTWIWNGSDWASPQGSGGPGDYASAMAYDPDLSKVVMVAAGSTWEWDGSVWTDLKPTGTPNLVGVVWLAYSPTSKKLLLAKWTGTAQTLTYWSFDGTAWSQPIDTGKTNSTNYRITAYDPVRDEWVVPSDSGPTTDVYKGGSWTTTSQNLSPARTEAGWAYDSDQQRLLVFSGLGVSGLNDIWAWNGSAWTKVSG
ncbi:MAG TPA: hypothetical protein VG015_06375 [Candidatus Dormibacteraeota bacterium]|nr:hypothetical protein [Candidatus Dormibacteraeota bacterium]